jgi:3-dehydroquinate synthetase
MPHGLRRDAARHALRYDKKFVRGRARWVLLKNIGHVVVREDVPPRLVEEMLAEYVTPGGK